MQAYSELSEAIRRRTLARDSFGEGSDEYWRADADVRRIKEEIERDRQKQRSEMIREVG